MALYLAGIWLLHDVPRSMSRLHSALSPIAIALVLLTPLAPQPILLTGAIVVGCWVPRSSPRHRSGRRPRDLRGRLTRRSDALTLD